MCNVGLTCHHWIVYHVGFYLTSLDYQIIKLEASFFMLDLLNNISMSNIYEFKVLMESVCHIFSNNYYDYIFVVYQLTLTIQFYGHSNFIVNTHYRTLIKYIYEIAKILCIYLCY